MKKNLDLIPIGKLAKITKTPVSTLRYYDEIGLFKPYYVDSKTNYRYYHVRQLYDIDFIISWRKLGFSVNDIKELVDNSNIETMIKLYKNKENEIKNNIKRLDEIKRIILEYKSKLEDLSGNKSNSMNNDPSIEMKNINTMDVIYVSSTGSNYLDYRDSLNKLNDLISKYNIDVKDFTNIRSHYYDNPYYNEKSLFELMIPVKNNLNYNYKFIKKIPSYRCASFLHYGEYNEALKSKVNFTIRWIYDSDYQYKKDEIIFIHLIGTPIINDPKKFLTEIRIPITD
jgi:DNA-binding transcriptional MerR regulator